MIISLLAIFGFGIANAEPIYQINGKCINSYSKSIEGVFDINCNKMLFTMINDKVLVDIKDNSNANIMLSIDNKNKKYFLNRSFDTKERIDEKVFNVCRLTTNFVVCDSYMNQENIVHIEFERT